MGERNHLYAIPAMGLRRWRRAAEITQQELAHYCGVCRATVIRWENPLNPDSPSIHHLLRLIEATGAIPEVLIRCLLTGGPDGQED